MRFGHAPLVIAVTRSRALDVLIAKRVPLIGADVFSQESRSDWTQFPRLDCGPSRLLLRTEIIAITD